MKMPKRFVRKCKIYKLFAEEGLDFSKEAMKELYLFETFGKGNIEIGGFNQSNNGYAVGKRWCDLQVTTWLEECEMFDDKGNEKSFYRGWYNVINELYKDSTFKDFHWWLDSVFRNFLKSKNSIHLLEEFKNGKHS